MVVAIPFAVHIMLAVGLTGYLAYQNGQRAVTDLSNQLRKQRPRLLTFLHHDAVAPTNNAAERELRPAVVVRKTSGCNRTDAGAEAHAVVASVLRTCQKQGLDPVKVLKYLLHSADTLMLDLVAKPKRGSLLPPAIASP